ncbi:MAG: HAMP domain-containing histidine kinase [Ferruginibacter sp.]|nr:HAMP domain-containing histidine kinase [Cytophagales bacterium]
MPTNPAALLILALLFTRPITPGIAADGRTNGLPATPALDYPGGIPSGRVAGNAFAGNRLDLPPGGNGRTRYEKRGKPSADRLKQENAVLLQSIRDQEAALKKSGRINYFLTAGLAIAAGLVVFLSQRHYGRQRVNRLLMTNQTIQHQNEALRATNERLEKSEQHLLQTNATKDKFFSIISHDLKGPLNSLTGFLQILDIQVDAFSPEELKAFAKDTNKSVKNLLDLLDNLLLWSRSQTGTIEYAPQPLNLSEIVAGNLNLMHVAAQKKDIRLQADPNGTLPVYADQNMLNLVLRNLISNAIKFTPSGGSVVVGASDQDGYVEVSVRDSGIGMSPSTLEHLFRLDTYHTTSGTNAEKGNGLGLILCKEFVEKNGGILRVESTEGQGTTFRFTVPVAGA